MGINKENYLKIRQELDQKKVTLVAVSKMKPVEDILQLYQLGQRDFGENYVQELLEKFDKLPQDIRWHFIGHLQSNKVKYIAPFVHLIHGIDSFRLLKEVNKQGKKISRQIDVLLQFHISREETKFGFDDKELDELFQLHSNELDELRHIIIRGFMGMASFTENKQQVKNEFEKLKNIFDTYSELQKSNCNFQFLSMGMSDDYPLAIEQGSNMVRIGSLIFGKRR